MDKAEIKKNVLASITTQNDVTETFVNQLFNRIGVANDRGPNGIEKVAKFRHVLLQVRTNIPWALADAYGLLGISERLIDSTALSEDEAARARLTEDQEDLSDLTGFIGVWYLDILDKITNIAVKNILPTENMDEIIEAYAYGPLPIPLKRNPEVHAVGVESEEYNQLRKKYFNQNALSPLDRLNEAYRKLSPAAMYLAALVGTNGGPDEVLQRKKDIFSGDGADALGLDLDLDLDLELESKDDSSKLTSVASIPPIPPVPAIVGNCYISDHVRSSIRADLGLQHCV
jgi:hypothetical protein